MNVYDSDRMLELVNKEYFLVSSPDNADAILINTCHIREKAAEKVYSEIGKYAYLKDSNKKLKIIVAGCVAQAEGEAMLQRQPLIDAIIGPQMYQILPDILLDKLNFKKIFLDFDEEKKFQKLGFDRKKALMSSFITIQEGCDKFCSFCVVPFTRGAEFSRNVEDIVNEAKSLTDKGCKEIILLGQNVNAYHGIGKSNAQTSLAKLIQELEKIKKLDRISYTTSHPNDMTQDLIDLHGNSNKLNPYLHLPVQSGSDLILKNMNRKYTKKKYLDVIEKIRKKIPDIAISSDFIVGFPGETKKDFKDTIKLIKEVKFAHSYSFKYSKRIGTKAYNVSCNLSEEEKDNRLQELQSILNDQKKCFNKTFVEKEVEVFLKGKAKKENQFRGTTKWMQTAIFECNKNKVGDKVNLRIKKAFDNCLIGELI